MEFQKKEGTKQLQKKFNEGIEFTKDKVSPGMFDRSEYNLNRLVDAGKLNKRVEIDDNTLQCTSYYWL